MGDFFTFAMAPSRWIHRSYREVCARTPQEAALVEALWGRESFSRFLLERFALGWPALEDLPLEARRRDLILLPSAALEEGCLRLGLSLQWRFFKTLLMGERLRALKESLGEAAFGFVRTTAPLLGGGDRPFESREASLSLGVSGLLSVLGPLPGPVESRLALKLPSCVGMTRAPCGFALPPVEVTWGRVERVFESLDFPSLDSAGLDSASSEEV